MPADPARLIADGDTAQSSVGAAERVGEEVVAADGDGVDVEIVASGRGDGC
jgi:hypothetical protein